METIRQLVHLSSFQNAPWIGLLYTVYIYSVVKVNSHNTILLFQVGGLSHIPAAFTDVGPG